MPFRTFICKNCGSSWNTEEFGRFTLCPTCKDTKLAKARVKICEYRLCEKTFTDSSLKNSQRFCCPEHRRREKMFRLGKAQDNSYFRANKPKVNPLCMSCGERWLRLPEDKSVRCPSCRNKARIKICYICGLEFLDDSLKGTRKSHPACVAKSLNLKPERKPESSPLLEHRRFIHVREGGGRVDIFESLRKDTMTWWGRLSEEIFKGYRPRAVDVNALSGNSSPFDFQDPELGRVNVKGAKGRIGPEGRNIWTVSVEGIKHSCDHIFVVGYSKNRSIVEHLWLLPSVAINDRLVRFAPGSREYVYHNADVSSSWGLVVANQKLQWATSLPPPIVPTDKFAWLDDSNYLFERAPGHRGRKGELLYRQLYPESKDINREMGSISPYDFLDPDGTRVNVKISRYKIRSDAAYSRWSFSRGFLVDHNCDAYSCLCLDSSGQLIREYRIPAAVWGQRRVIHIYLASNQWLPYLVPLKKEGLRVIKTLWAEPRPKLLSIEQATTLIDSLDLGIEGIREKVVQILRQVPFPIRERNIRALTLDWEALCSSVVRVENCTLVGVSNNGLGLCDSFFQYRYDACYKQLPSVRNAWEDDSRLLKAVSFQLKVGDPLRPWNVFRALRATLRTPSNFRPAFAKAIVSKYCPVGGLLLDPCAGYGGRAVGTLAAGRRYLGIDPHPDASESFKNLFNFLKLSENQASFIFSTFEDVVLDIMADCIFTSPPYFCIERYSEDKNQSWIRYPSWEIWRDAFLKVMITKCYQHLKPGCIFCFNLADVHLGTKTYPLIKSAIDLAISVGFLLEETIIMPLGRFGKQEKTEPILIFRKKESADENL